MNADWHAVEAARHLPPGKLVAARVAGVRLVIGRTASGPFALDGICPHAGAVLAEGLVDGELLVCPLHAFAFEVATGRCLDDETCSLRRYPVRDRDGVLEVAL